jgi:hypothetical protein
MSNQLTAARAIANKMTLATVTDQFDCGNMSRREFDRYIFAWRWTAPRFSGGHAMAQDAYYKMHGADHYRSRMDQVNAICARIAASDSRRLLESIGR